MQAGGPAPVLRDTALELIHHFDDAVFHYIVDVAAEEYVGVQRVLRGGQNVQILLVEQAAAAEYFFDTLNAGVGEPHVARVFIGRVVNMRTQPGDYGIDAIGERFRQATRDYQRDARFIDQDGIGLVDYRKGECSLHQFIVMARETVAQIVEADLIGSCVSDVATIGRPAFGGGHILRYVPDGKPEPFVNGTHPGGIAAREIVVGGQHMHAAALQGEPDDGGHSRQCLAFAGLHFSDIATLQGERAEDLHVEHAQAQEAFRDYGGECEGRDQVVFRMQTQLSVVQSR